VKLLLLAALAVAAHYLFWIWRLRLQAVQDEVIRATTADGWSLALGRRAPRAPPRAPPVLLVHGLAVNRLFLDFPFRAHSLAATLAGAGLDCFSLDLRGHGGSRRGPSRDWTVDDYIRLDLPAALEAVRRATGAPRALVVGHSQGALIALAGATLYPEQVAGVVALAGPTHFGRAAPPSLFSKFLFLGRRLVRFAAITIAPVAGLLHLRVAQASINTRNVERPVLRRMLASAVENVAAGVARQFAFWAAQDRFCSMDGALDYRAGLSRARQPALFVAAALDGLAPPAVVRAGYQAWGGEKELFTAGLSSGLSAEYGHGDLVFGRRAPEEVFPRIRDWLLAWPRGAA